MTIPIFFNDFDNNIESVGMGIKWDGDYSDIFDWVDSQASPFSLPNGHVFGAEVVFLREVLPTESQYICFKRLWLHNEG